MNDDLLLTPREVAAYLRIDFQTVKRMIKRGDLKAIKINSRGDYRILSNDLNAFIGDKS